MRTGLEKNEENDNSSSIIESPNTHLSLKRNAFGIENRGISKIEIDTNNIGLPVKWVCRTTLEVTIVCVVMGSDSTWGKDISMTVFN